MLGQFEVDFRAFIAPIFLSAASIVCIPGLECMIASRFSWNVQPTGDTKLLVKIKFSCS